MTTIESMALPPLERPRPARLPEVQRRLEIAAGLRREGEDLIAHSVTETTSVKVLEQRLSSLEGERRAAQQRLSNIEGQDFKARLEQCRASVRQLYGITNLTPGQMVTLNDAAYALAWLPEVVKEIPLIVKDLKSRISGIEKEIAKLTSPETK